MTTSEETERRDGGRSIAQTFRSGIANLTIFGKSPIDAYLRLNRRIWYHLPHFFNFLDGLVSSRSTSYQLNISASPSFTGKGLKGYMFDGLKNRRLEILFADVEKGHDTFMISKKITRIYYVVEGNGFFTIDGEKLGVYPGMLLEVPPKVEYSYSGHMKLIIISIPPWREGNDRFTKQNPDVFAAEL
jgi:mannose-6-phosphate isomerase-like protein (cupin superfamily)